LTQEIEIEFKNLLTNDEYKKIITCFPFPTEGIIQTNYYFETPNFLLKQHQSALRIREKNGHYQLTLKEPLEEGLLETHDKLTKEEAENWIHGDPIPQFNTSRQLKKMNISPEDLQYYGKLITTRLEYKEGKLTYVLDESHYNNHSDFELEIEAPTYEKGLSAFESILETLNIPHRETPNKIERFFSTFNDQ